MTDEAMNVLRQALAATQSTDKEQRKQGVSKINGGSRPLETGAKSKRDSRAPVADTLTGTYAFVLLELIVICPSFSACHPLIRLVRSNCGE